MRMHVPIATVRLQSHGSYAKRDNAIVGGATRASPDDSNHVFLDDICNGAAGLICEIELGV